MTDQIIFPMGDRLSTWLCLLAFCLLAAWRTDRRPLLAAVAWLTSYEAAYQIAAMILHTPHPIPVIGPVSLSLLIGMPTIAVALYLTGTRPDLRILAVAGAVFLVWLAAGFHVNDTGTVVSVQGEVLNELSKTLWALAYFWPLLSHERKEVAHA